MILLLIEINNKTVNYKINEVEWFWESKLARNANRSVYAIGAPYRENFLAKEER
jgi:hypothetical protein